MSQLLDVWEEEKLAALTCILFFIYFEIKDTLKSPLLTVPQAYLCGQVCS